MPSAASMDTPGRRHSFGTPLRSFREANVPLNDDASEIRSRRKSLVDSIRRKSLNVSGSSIPVRAGSSGLQNVSTTPSRRNSIRPLEVVTPIQKIPDEQMYINFEEWMKMATDNKINANNSWKLALIDYFHEMTLLKDGDSINFQKASCTLDGCVKIYTSRVDSVATETGKLLKNNDENEENDNQADPDRRTRKKTTRSETALAKDYSALTVKKFDLEFSVDPLFKKTSADFDEGGAHGLLLNHLSVDTDGKIIFDASDAIPDEDEDENSNDNMTIDDDNQPKIDISKLRSKYLSGLQQIFNKEICPSLQHFDFSGNSNPDFDYTMHNDDDGVDINSNDDVIEVNRNDDYEEVNRNEDYEGNNYDEGVGINYEISGVFDEDDMNQHARLTENDFVMAMVSNENELFSYFDSAFLRNWAGPEHWKLKKTSKNKGTTETEGETKERKKKETELVTFIESEDLDERFIFASGRSTINAPKLAEKVPHGHLLPDDMHFSSKQLLQLFLKPQVMLNSKRQNEAQAELESDDVALPDMTKRIDVKKLKENIWKTLTINTKFSGVFGDLKKIYPQKKMKDISVPFCFICLLHLANEKSLEVTNGIHLMELQIDNVN
ncbi:14825_t:CDS:2 [Funneliformis geosporum]|nr:14825_t:CDS:2 [Funneliformis geosporum]